jgi:hypothetical protein
MVILLHIRDQSILKLEGKGVFYFDETSVEISYAYETHDDDHLWHKVQEFFVSKNILWRSGSLTLVPPRDHLAIFVEFNIFSEDWFMTYVYKDEYESPGISYYVKENYRDSKVYVFDTRVYFGHNRVYL